MRKQLRQNKDGSYYYSFLYFDKEQNKMVRISRATIQKRFGCDITDSIKADLAIKVLDAEYESMVSKLEKRAKWESEYYEFHKLLEQYSEKQKKNAPNSYKNNIHYLRYYVLHYFLTVAKCNNIERWPDFYENFREWLVNEATLIKNPEKLISYGAKNHCIKTLNTFMRQIYREKLVDKLYLCEKFPSYQLNERSIDDVISIDEMETVYSRLLYLGADLEAGFFRLLYFTGMRFNEALGISLQDVHEGNPEHEYLQRILSRHEIKPIGYIVLMSQPAHETRALRDVSGKIKRKPLKGRKRINEKNARIIVISDKTLWKQLGKLYNQKVDEFEYLSWGTDPTDYPLFEGIDKSSSTRRLKKAFKSENLPYRSWHCCRHSCATNLIGATGDHNLARLWLGHSSSSVIERYIHIHQAIVRSAKKFGQGTSNKIKKLEI